MALSTSSSLKGMQRVLMAATLVGGGLHAFLNRGALSLLLLGHVANLALRKGKWIQASLIFLVAFPRFRIPKSWAFDKKTGGDERTFLQHLVVALVFRRMGLTLPPTLNINLFTLIRYAFSRASLSDVFWQEVLLEKEFLGDEPIVQLSFISNSRDPTKVATPVFMIQDPDLIEEVMSSQKNVKAFPSRGDTGFTQLVGEGLLGLETGAMHTKHRRLIGKFLSDNYLKRFSKQIEEEIEVFISLWKKKDRVDAYYDLSMLTLDVIMRIAFGAGAAKEKAQGKYQKAEEDPKQVAMEKALKVIITRTMFPLQKYLPIFSGEPELREINVVREDITNQMLGTTSLDELRSMMSQKEGEEDNILSALVGSKNEDGTPALTFSEIENELHTVRGAGHETSGNTMCWALYLLQKHPEKLAKLRSEVHSVLGDRKIATYEDAKQLTYAHAVAYETLRMFPTVPRFPREAAVDTTIGNYSCPAGTYVFVIQMALNRNPKIFPKPDEFIPERFSENLPDLQMSKPVGVPGGPSFGFLPFGSGNRTCIGQRLAMLEQVQILASIVCNFNFKLDMKESDVRPIAEVTLGPKHGLFLKISPIEEEETA